MAMAEEMAGTLGERVILESWRTAQDEAGDDAGDWQRVGEFAAAVVPDGDGRARDGETRRQRPGWRLTLRAPLAVTLTSRFVWRGTVLTVLSVATDPRRADRVTVRCEARGQ